MPDDLVFVDPPVDQRCGSTGQGWPERVARLAEHPGRWVDATETWGANASGAQPIRRRYGLEVLTRTMPSGKRHLFVRYPEGK